MNDFYLENGINAFVSEWAVFEDANTECGEEILEPINEPKYWVD